MESTGLSLNGILAWLKNGQCTDPKFILIAYNIIWDRIARGDDLVVSDNRVTFDELIRFVEQMRRGDPVLDAPTPGPSGSRIASIAAFKRPIKHQPTLQEGPVLNRPIAGPSGARALNESSVKQSLARQPPMLGGRNPSYQLGNQVNPAKIQELPSKGYSNDGSGVADPLGVDLHKEPSSEMRYFIIQREYEKLIKKFNTMSNSFKPVDDESNPLQWLKAAFQELLDYILRNTQSSDRVGIVLRNHNSPEKPLGISFRRADQLSVPVILNVIEKVLQSNAQFFSQDAMTVNIDAVTLPVGRGRARLTGSSFDDFCKKKHGIIVVPTVDNMCLASALVIAIAFKEGDQKLPELTSGSPLLLNRALHLCTFSQVDLTNGGGYDHIQKFQQYLTSYTIVVYNSRSGETTYFQGPRDRDRIVLNLILEQQHYNVVTI